MYVNAILDLDVNISAHTNFFTPGSGIWLPDWYEKVLCSAVCCIYNGDY